MQKSLFSTKRMLGNALNQGIFGILVTAGLLSGCTNLLPNNSAPTIALQGVTASTVAAKFVAPLPAVDAAQQAKFSDWWAQFNDATLTQLVAHAIAHNTTVTQARASIVVARSVLAESRAGMFPSVNVTASADTSRQRQAGITTNSRNANAGIDAMWELDLFGFNQSLTAAADARATQAIAQLGDARVSISAEVVSTYVNLRTSQMLEAVYAQDRTATAQTANLTSLKIKAGFEAQANAGLAEGDAAEAANRYTGQREQTDLYVKALVALTNKNEATLRTDLQLSSAPVALPAPARFAVTTLPAQLLEQRADIAAATANVLAASADWRASRADQYPRISLLGNISFNRLSTGGNSANNSSLSFGPAINLPLFDAGKRQAATEGAQSRIDIAQAQFEQTALRAVQEAEEGLVRLDSANTRAKIAQDAVRGYVSYLEGAQLRHKNGLANLLELAQAQRTTVAANAALLQVQRERVQAWISLYKALGGGWKEAQ